MNQAAVQLQTEYLTKQNELRKKPNEKRTKRFDKILNYYQGNDEMLIANLNSILNIRVNRAYPTLGEKVKLPPIYIPISGKLLLEITNKEFSMLEPDPIRMWSGYIFVIHKTTVKVPLDTMEECFGLLDINIRLDNVDNNTNDEKRRRADEDICQLWGLLAEMTRKWMYSNILPR